MDKRLLAAVCLLGAHTVVSANDLYNVMVQEQNNHVLLSPCADLQTVWPATFDRADDERAIRRYIQKYPPLSPQRPHAGFFARVIAEPRYPENAPSAAAAVQPPTQTEPVRFAVREILELHEGSCSVIDILETMFPQNNTR